MGFRDSVENSRSADRFPESLPMDDRKLQPLIREIRALHDQRYAAAAYLFVLEALEYTLFLHGKSQAGGEQRHVNGRELLEGIRRYAAEEFGPLAPFAFRSWGVHRTDDFGDIVFQMCEAGLLNASEDDRPEDFADAFDFEEAFALPGSVQGSS